MVFSTFKKTLHLLKSLKVRNIISGRYSQISSTSDVPFDEISNSKLKGISRNNNEGRGPITSSTVFHSLKAMQDVHLCMYVCMRVCTVYICFTR